jgi:hypothetical protein
VLDLEGQLRYLMRVQLQSEKLIQAPNVADRTRRARRKTGSDRKIPVSVNTHWSDAIAQTPGNLRKELEEVVRRVLVELPRETILRVRIVEMKMTISRPAELEVQETSYSSGNHRTTKKVRLVPEKADPAGRPRLHKLKSDTRLVGQHPQFCELFQYFMAQLFITGRLHSGGVVLLRDQSPVIGELMEDLLSESWIARRKMQQRMGSGHRVRSLFINQKGTVETFCHNRKDEFMSPKTVVGF